jgi:hypothetical protein
VDQSQWYREKYEVHDRKYLSTRRLGEDEECIENPPPLLEGDFYNIFRIFYISCLSSFSAASGVDIVLPIRNRLMIAIATTQYTNIARNVVHSIILP